MNIIQDRKHLLTQSLFDDILFNLIILIYRIDSSLLSERNEQIKNKLRERLKSIIDETNKHSLNVNEDTDYFQLIYECIETRMIFLNFIDFKAHSHIERDVDLAILQALLNGKKK